MWHFRFFRRGVFECSMWLWEIAAGCWDAVLGFCFRDFKICQILRCFALDLGPSLLLSFVLVVVVLGGV